MPRLRSVAVSLGLFANVLLAIIQAVSYGYASIQAPADVKAFPWATAKP